MKGDKKMFKKIKKLFIKARAAAGNHARRTVCKAKIAARSAKLAYHTAKNVLTVRAHMLTAGTAAEAYVDTGVKILIAVVIGALLLGLLYVLFNDTIMPTVTEKVQGLFDYAG